MGVISLMAGLFIASVFIKALGAGMNGQWIDFFNIKGR